MNSYLNGPVTIDYNSLCMHSPMGLPLLISMQPGFKSFTCTSSLHFYLLLVPIHDLLSLQFIFPKQKQILEEYRKIVEQYRTHARNNPLGSKPPSWQFVRSLWAPTFKHMV